MEKQNKPKVRFKGFEEDWNVSNLSQLSNLLTGHPFESKYFAKKGILLVRGMNIKRGYLDFSESISEYWPTSSGLEPYVLHKGDIVIQMDGALIGKSYAKVGEKHLPALLVQRVTRLRNESHLSEIIYQYLQKDFLRYINSIKTETAVPHLSLNDIRNFNLVVPVNKTEQKKIGSFFENLDKLLTEHQQKHTKLQALKKAMLAKMFPQQGQTVPEIRFKGFSGDWKPSMFKNMADLKRGLTYSPLNLTNNIGVKVLRSSNINEDIFIQKEDDVFVKEEAINIDFAKENDILITSANGSSRLVGKHALIKNLNCKAVHGGFMLLATAKNPFFLNASMNTEWYAKFVNQFTAGGGGSIGNLSKSDLEEQIVLIPSDDEQEKIGNYFKNIDHIITNHQIQIEKLQNLKKAFLSKMFI